MDVTKHDLADLFEGRLVYVVPNYQRLYVWNQEDQWEPLWLDIAEVSNALLERALEKNLNEVDPKLAEPHFMGAVVLKMGGSTPNMARQRRVIDGQQRLTTLQLMLTAAVTALTELELVDPADRLRELVENRSRSTTPNSHSYKISHYLHKPGGDYESFAKVISAALDGEAITHIEGPMGDCYRFFYEKVIGWLSDQKLHVVMAGSALATALLMKLQVVGIYLDSHEREHIIFETLNARGEPLTEWDKIKNYLLYKADEAPHLEQASFFDSYLDGFDDPWWRRHVGRGAQKRPRTDVFADYWLESVMRTPVAVRRVFREFQKYVEGQSHILEPTIQAFAQDARYFRQFERPDVGNKNREDLFHRRRRDMGVGAFWPLLLQLQRLDAEQRERGSWLVTLESYLFRRLITGHQARSYDRVALELLDVIADERPSASIGSTITNHLLEYSKGATRWPKDEEVKQAVLHRHLPWYARRLVLSALERHLMSNRAAIVDLSSNVQIEHIMPRRWKPDSWPLPASDEPSVAVERRQQQIETLGNLTLLNGRLNAAISNASWDLKREEVEKSDNLFLNRRLLEDASNSWTEEDIDRRGRWMADLILQIWPRGENVTS